MRTAAVMLFAGILDIIFGDPHWLYHPVRLIGHTITFFEKILRRIFPKSQTGERAGGLFLVVLVLLCSVGVPFLLLLGAYQISIWLGLALEIFFCYQLLAAKSLKKESMRVYESLKAGDLTGARAAVSMIVGRDTQSLDEEGVTKAAVETVAENASDGVAAPLFYMAIGGAVLTFAYKAINTMDSMVGYKNEKYQFFGTAAAKLDDIVNFLPARICGLLFVISAFILGQNGKGAWRIFLRDRKKHASPNSAQTEAAAAGALDIQLAGDACYFGKWHHKPTIGDAVRPVVPEDIKTANRLLYMASALALLVFAGGRILLLYVVRI